ncbi:hypothetical protein E3U44_00315 [Nitrosococcus wardiae]|uniref:Addiction module toxin, HicA family n=1 Tax=Nitrosococcus wardiae TaxID=1814290 RepID=A0A4P7BTC7_9GAMM|nr:hypothetical protein E3U44_00315 [Nitrosococcus wardiae]
MTIKPSICNGSAFYKLGVYARGSHRNFKHPKGMRVTLSGKPGTDAKPYQEREVKQRIQELQQ